MVRFIGEAVEVDREQLNAHLISVLGGDAEIGAVWAAVVAGSFFTVEGPGLVRMTVRQGVSLTKAAWHGSLMR